MFDVGVLDNWFTSMLEGQPEKAAPLPKHGHKGQKGHQQPHHRPEVVANESFVKTMDWIWPGVILVLSLILNFALLGQNGSRGSTTTNVMIAYGLPLILCCVAMTRPIRIGLGIGAVLLVYQMDQMRSDPAIYSSRSYFGTISVTQGTARKDTLNVPFRQLVHGTTLHGQNFLRPQEKKDWGKPDQDWSRLATTYYHREGPTGRVMEKFNWFPGPANTYWADARLPASLFSSTLLDIGTGTSLPMTTLATLWSEPPYATVGLGTGTMASYVRPYQHVHFYEIDNQIFRLSLLMPTRDIKTYAQYKQDRSTTRETYFNYLEGGVERGGTVQVLMGDARLRMALPYKNHYTSEIDDGGGPEKFYHMMVVDAFSSDAIPAHLLTEQAFAMYFGRLTEEGILCVHTSNKFADLAKVVVAICDKSSYGYLRGHDSNDDKNNNGHTTSEWVMVARKQEYLSFLTGDTTFLQNYKAAMTLQKRGGDEYWGTYASQPRYCWTDDYYNLLSVVRFLKD